MKTKQNKITTKSKTKLPKSKREKQRKKKRENNKAHEWKKTEKTNLNKMCLPHYRKINRNQNKINLHSTAQHTPTKQKSNNNNKKSTKPNVKRNLAFKIEIISNCMHAYTTYADQTRTGIVTMDWDRWALWAHLWAMREWQPEKRMVEQKTKIKAHTHTHWSRAMY